MQVNHTHATAKPLVMHGACRLPLMLDSIKPFNVLEVTVAIETSYGVEPVIEDGHAQPTSSLVHSNNGGPAVIARIIAGKERGEIEIYNDKARYSQWIKEPEGPCSQNLVYNYTLSYFTCMNF